MVAFARRKRAGVMQFARESTMPSPNPQPRPQPVRNPNPQGNPTAKKQARVSAATIKPRTQPKPQTEPKPEKRPGSFRLLVGLIAALTGAAFLTVEGYEVSRFISRVGPGALTVVETGDFKTFGSPTKASTDQVADFVSASSAYLPYVGVTFGLLLILFAGVCLKKRTGIFLVTLVVLGTAALAVFESQAITPRLSWIVIGAAGLAYILQSGRERITAPPVGMLGYLLVFLSLMAVTRQWFNWPAILEWASAQWNILGSADVTAFFNQWGELVTWCIVLALATLGASFSNGRLLQVLGATMLVILITLLLRDARYELVHFPQLGVKVDPIPSYAIANVQNWQWLVLVELAIVAAVLVYRGLGAGGFTIAMAALWLFVGFKVDSLTGRFLLGSLSGNLNIGGPNSPSGQSAGISGDIIAATAASVWIYLNAIFAGIVAVCGLRLMLKEASTRWWVGNGLWLVFSMLAMWVYMHWPRFEEFSLVTQLQVLVAYEVHLVVIPMVAALAAAVFGIWALRWNSRYDTWLYVAATIVFLGTLASFGTLAVMINYSFLEPLPIVSYVALAVGQSSLMWILLLHVNFRDRQVEQHRRPTAPPTPGAVPSLA